jgi:chemotaxis signal transduction protein
VSGAGERLLTFEVAGGLFALPIAGVLEVVERSDSACVPGIPGDVARVMNYHGDALPVVRRERLLELEESAESESQHVLIVTDRSSTVPRLGICVDRVLGLVDAAPAAARGTSVVAERRPIDGRVAGVLDPNRVVARAREVIDGSLGRSE